VTVASPETTIDKIKSWAQQSTTGQGASVIIGAVGGIATGAMSNDIFYVTLAVGLFLLAFPQANKTTISAVTSVATDVEAIGKSYMAGHAAGQTLGQAATGILPMAAPLVADASALVAALKENTSATLTSASVLTAQSAPAPTSVAPAAPAATPVVAETTR
jgi:hypothetical protein